MLTVLPRLFNKQWSAVSFQLEPFLNDVKGKNLKLKANCTSLLKELDQRAEELRQKQQELDRVEQ